jgi:demethylmenaquinone methyltransferase / 2-methoxy-6-polyprenyl-1,4-benzoquinol methylase
MGELTVDKTPSRIAGMFDAVAPRYDLLNHLLSAGLDRRWRARAIAEARPGPGSRVLDLCTGTADLAVAAVQSGPGVSVVGIDFAGEMLRLAARKTASLGLDRAIRLVRGDATALPLPDASCDAATIGFGIRNVVDAPRALRELARVLRPGGRLAILEFGEPRIPGIKTMYAWYFRYVLPAVGRLVSRHRSAYSYLPASVTSFPSPPRFSEMIAASGFSRVRAVPLTFGIVYLYVAERQGEGHGAAPPGPEGGLL